MRRDAGLLHCTLIVTCYTLITGVIRIKHQHLSSWTGMWSENYDGGPDLETHLNTKNCSLGLKHFGLGLKVHSLGLALLAVCCWSWCGTSSLSAELEYHHCKLIHIKIVLSKLTGETAEDAMILLTDTGIARPGLELLVLVSSTVVLVLLKSLWCWPSDR